MDIKHIQELIKILDTSNLTALEIQEGDSKIRLERANEVMMSTHVAAAPQNVAATPVDESEVVSGMQINAPLVGNFYLTPSPEEPSFVELGQVVNKGDVLCILEAMKVMNEIVSPTSGTIKKIYPQNGEIVEFGQTLFVIE